MPILRTVKTHIATVVLFLLALASSGCTTFMSSKKLDMQPFAENTVTAIGELYRLDKPPIWVKLRAYRVDPVVVELRREHAPMGALLKGMSNYSLQVVSLHDAHISEEHKVQGLVRYLREASASSLVKEAEDELVLTPARQEELLNTIAAKKTFLEALGAAEPIVAAVLARGLVYSDRLGAATTKAAAVIEEQVQAEYASMINNRTALLALQDRAIRAMVQAEQSGLGEQEPLKAIQKETPFAKEPKAVERTAAGKAELTTVTSLTAQLARIQAALDQIKPEYDAYRESLLELDRLRDQALERMRLERGVLMQWARSHRNLGRGVAVPPAFDFLKILGDTTSRAAVKLVP